MSVWPVSKIPRDFGPTDCASLLLAGLAPVETLSLKDLTLKLVMLMALVVGNGNGARLSAVSVTEQHDCWH